MRILFAITRGEVGGAQEHIRLLAKHLARDGHDVGVITQPDSFLANEFKQFGGHTFDWPSIVRNPHPLKDFRAHRELKAVIREFRPDVLHLHSAKAGVLGRGATRTGRARDCVTIYTCHHPSFGPNRKWSHRIVGRPLEQLTLPLLDGFISVGARDLARLQNLAPGVASALIPNGVDPVDNPSAHAEPSHVALWVARFASPKDPLLAVRAWKQVVAQVPDAKLRMCGTGPLLQGTRDLVLKEGLSSNIEVLGFVDDLSAEYEHADVFVLTTRVEGGITMATLEAMSNGLVPVVSDAGDLPYLAVEQAGMLVGDHPKSVAEAFVRLFTEPDLLRSLRAKAIAHTQTWTATDTYNATVAFYERVLASKNISASDR